MIVSKAKLAAVFGVSPTTVGRWVEQGAPVDAAPDGGKTRLEWRFDTAEVLQWRMSRAAHERSQAPARELADARLRQKLADAALRELELGVRRGVMVHIDDVAAEVMEQLSVLKSRLVTMPSRLAHQIASEADTATCLQMMNDEIDEMLAGLVR